MLTGRDDSPRRRFPDDPDPENVATAAGELNDELRRALNALDRLEPPTGDHDNDSAEDDRP